jgi:hypothetical protein
MKGRNHLEDFSIHGMIILKQILKKWDGVDNIHLAQDSEHWRATGNGTIEHSDSNKFGEFLH